MWERENQTSWKAHMMMLKAKLRGPSSIFITTKNSQRVSQFQLLSQLWIYIIGHGNEVSFTVEDCTHVIYRGVMDMQLVCIHVRNYMVTWIRVHMPWIGNHDIWRTDAAFFFPVIAPRNETSLSAARLRSEVMLSIFYSPCCNKIREWSVAGQRHSFRLVGDENISNSVLWVGGMHATPFPFCLHKWCKELLLHILKNKEYEVLTMGYGGRPILQARTKEW